MLRLTSPAHVAAGKTRTRAAQQRITARRRVAAPNRSEILNPTALGLGQLFVRMMTRNFEEGTKARKEGRKAVYLD